MPDKIKAETEIDLLSSLEDGDVITQQGLAGRLAVSVGMVNALLKRAVNKGLVKARSAPYKRWAYYLTPKGFSEKSRLVAEYLETSLDFFRQAKQEYGDLFARAEACGTRRFVLVGRGELAEIAILAAREAGVEIAGLYDREMNAGDFHGVPVLRDMPPLQSNEAAVITASRRPQEALDAVLETVSERSVLAPALLKISDASGVSARADEVRESA